MTTKSGGPDPQQAVTVVAAVIEREGLILIAQRRKDGRHPLKWEFPGGKVEQGESNPEALRRELAEELDIQAEIGPELERYAYTYPGKPPLLLVFHSLTRFQGEPRNCVFEGLAWTPREGLTQYDFLEGDTEFVRRLAANDY